MISNLSQSLLVASVQNTVMLKPALLTSLQKKALIPFMVTLNTQTNWVEQTIGGPIIMMRLSIRGIWIGIIRNG